MFVTDDTHFHVSNSVVCVSFTLIGGHYLYYSNFYIYRPILGAELIITSWRQYLICNDPSASRYGEPLRYQTNVAFRFLPEYVRRIIVSFCIVNFKNIILIRMCRLIFFIVNLSNLLFWKNTTPTIINIFLSVIRFYIFFINSCIMVYKVKKYLFVEDKR